jgi:hypothetical protein
VKDAALERQRDFSEITEPPIVTQIDAATIAGIWSSLRLKQIVRYDWRHDK